MLRGTTRSAIGYIVLVVGAASLGCGNLSLLNAQESKAKARPTPTGANPAVPANKPVQPAVPSSEPRVRFDGLYYAKVGGPAGNPTYLYFRFYPDSTGVTTYSSGKPAQVARWLNKDHQNVDEGTYQLDGMTLKLVVGNERANTTYSGTLATDAWTLNPQNPNPTKFAFAQVSFPKKVAASRNRPPKIVPTIRKVDSFDYDSAGRTVGVTTTIEITASDPDGDTLTYAWSSSAGSITGNGPKGVWQRPLEAGQASPGVVTVVVTDGKGGRVSRDFAFQ